MDKKIIVLILVLILVFILLIHSFLAVTESVPAEVLVVEGWLPDSDLQLAAYEVKNRNYSQVITIGGPLSDSTSHNKNNAQQAVQKLISYGVEKNALTAVPFFKKTKHKTFMSFIALREWILRSNFPVHSLNIFTGSVHARKSWTICRRVLGKRIKIGIIAAPAVRYDPQFWWLSKRGIRLVFKNSLGYLYALFFPWQVLLGDGL